MSKFDKPSRRKRFWELREIVDEFDAKAEVHRARAKKLGQDMAPLLEEQKAELMKVRELQAQYNLGEVKGEMSFISKGLAGKVGKRPGRE